MNISFYENLHNEFITIRHLHSGDICDDERLEKVKNNIYDIRSELEKEVSNNNHKLLLYCIDTLFEILSEGNRQKIFDFADTIHNIPEICMGKRDLKSFKKDICAFRKKYGKTYFKDYDFSLSPLIIGIMNIASPLFIFEFYVFWVLGWLMGVAHIILGYATPPNWIIAVAVFPVFIPLFFSFFGICYGIVKRAKRHGVLCIILSVLNLINILGIYFLMYYFGSVG